MSTQTPLNLSPAPNLLPAMALENFGAQEACAARIAAKTNFSHRYNRSPGLEDTRAATSKMRLLSFMLICAAGAYLLEGAQAQNTTYAKYNPCAPPSSSVVNKVRRATLLLPRAFTPHSLKRACRSPATHRPCLNPTLQGDPIVIGIAYWPGGTVLEWCATFTSVLIAGAPALPPPHPPLPPPRAGARPPTPARAFPA